MSYDSYASLTDALHAIGLTGQSSRSEQLIVSTQNGPVWPNRGNSFWLSCQNGTWYLGTWAPICYRIPANQNLITLCLSCMESGSSAMYRVPEEIAKRFDLERISDSEFERLFPKADDAE